VVVRTLDAGSDKAPPFLSHAKEPNPALGVRGIRTAATHPQVFHDQLQAIKEAAEAESADLWVMAPMIATVAKRSTLLRRRGVRACWSLVAWLKRPLPHSGLRRF
jgi:phosphotransferase system enzyme I (PtsI)